MSDQKLDILNKYFTKFDNYNLNQMNCSECELLN